MISGLPEHLGSEEEILERREPQNGEIQDILINSAQILNQPLNCTWVSKKPSWKFKRTEHMLAHKVNLNTFHKTKLFQIMFSNDNSIN